jgi:hypothetical protein
MSAPSSSHNTELPSNSMTSEDNSRFVQASNAGMDPSTAQTYVNGSGGARQSKSEAEIAADKLYEERMEDEYAKREGGA